MTKIEWTDKTWNPIRARNRATGGVGHFCIHVSDGCKHCYAERMQPRFGNPIRYAAQDAGKVAIFLDEKTLSKPLRWKKPCMIFVCSMTDLFLEHHTDEMIDQIFAVMALCPQHTFQILTKRPERMRTYMQQLNDDEHVLDVPTLPFGVDQKTLLDALVRFEWPIPNVWLGVSAEDQKTADERIPDLLQTPGKVHFVSYEPALGPVDFSHLSICAGGGMNGFTGAASHLLWGREKTDNTVDWVICGGESGSNARPMHPDWARSVRDQCQAAGVAFHFKQWGAWTQTDAVPGGDLGGDMRCDTVRVLERDREPDGHIRKGDVLMRRVGKKAAGRLLDGHTHDEFPVTDQAQGAIL